jgi:hypothetical protein
LGTNPARYLLTGPSDAVLTKQMDESFVSENSLQLLVASKVKMTSVEKPPFKLRSVVKEILNFDVPRMLSIYRQRSLLDYFPAIQGNNKFKQCFVAPNIKNHKTLYLFNCFI